MEWLNDLLRNPKSIRKIRLSVAGILIIGIPFLYFGWFEDFSFAALFAWEVGVLGLLSFISIWTGRLEIGNLSFEIEIETNTELSDIIDDNKSAANSIKNTDLAADRLDEFNDKEQNRKNKELTKSLIDSLKIKRRNYQLYKKRDMFFVKLFSQYKSITEIDVEIKRLQTDGEVDLTHVPLAYGSVINTSIEFFRKRKKRNKKRGNYNPKTDGKKLSILKSMFTYTSIGGNAAIAFAIQDWGIMIGYYFMLAIGLTIAGTFEFLGVKRKTAVGYFNDKKDINKALTYIILDENVKKEEEIINKTDEKESRIMTKEEKKKVEDFCSSCIYYSVACGGLQKKDLENGLLECEDLNYKKEGE